jgi:hypothetical protein
MVLMLSQQGGGSTAHEGHVARRRPRAEKAESPGSDDKSGNERRARGKNLDKSEGHWADTPVLDDETAGQDTYEGHEIVLDGFAREFLILELPMFPRRSDLPTDRAAANPPLPADSQPGGDKPIDPRLSPLAELKSRLEKIKKE